MGVDDISPCTSTGIQYAIVDKPHEGHRVIIVDTPGFTYDDDLDVLRRIASWLASS